MSDSIDEVTIGSDGQNPNPPWKTRPLRAPVPPFRLNPLWLRQAPSLVLQNFLTVAGARFAAGAKQPVNALAAPQASRTKERRN